MTKWHQKTMYEFMVHGGFRCHNTDDRDGAIKEAQMQSKHCSHTIYVDDVDGNCIARCYRGLVELTTA